MKISGEVSQHSGHGLDIHTVLLAFQEGLRLAASLMMELAEEQHSTIQEIRMVLCCLLICSHIEGRLAFTVALDCAIFYQLFEGIFNGSLTNRGDEFHDFALCKLANLFIDSSAYQFESGQFFVKQIYPALKISVCGQDDSEQIPYERCCAKD